MTGNVDLGHGPPPSKLLGLELVRFVSAMAVLLWHYEHFYRAAGAAPLVASAQPLHALFAPLFDYGLFGVQIFWTISGFIFFRRYAAPIASGSVSTRQFFWLRVSRLYPLHLATLLIVASLQPVHVALTGHPFVYAWNGPLSFGLQLLMATTWLVAAPLGFNGPIWSVSAELFVYAAFFWIMCRVGPRPWLIGCLTAGCALLAHALPDFPPTACGQYFFAGGGAALLVEAAETSGTIARTRRAAATVFAIAVVGAYGTGWLGDPSMLPIVLLVAAPAGMILAAQDWTLLANHARRIQAAGNLTYASYLLHFPLQLIVAITVAATGTAVPVASPLFLLAYLGVTLALARLCFVHFERPAQDWIRAAMLRPRTLASVA